jgi:hypothetical protein
MKPSEEEEQALTGIPMSGSEGFWWSSNHHTIDMKAFLKGYTVRR